MKRLHQLSQEDIEAWRAERDRVGKQKYGDKHIHRYNLVDVVEELLDALNILEMFEDRKHRYVVGDGIDGHPELEKVAYYKQRALKNLILASIGCCIEIDKKMPDQLCTDGEGGYRPGWSEPVNVTPKDWEWAMRGNA